ncbi:MAG: alpha-keto acid decarboxylase family protein [Planctomycetes bacterium]|nr:alpha-keto acid decarboxylase family protein [Planctomycetota bacterium]
MPRSTVGQYLVRRLEATGLAHVFGIPGDYVLSFYDLLVASKMKVIGTCTEIGAGYAADAYARVNGLGALCITYCVGGLNALNAVAGAYAEKSPLIVISGAPGLSERRRSTLLHHQVRDYRTQFQIYEKVTVAAVALEDPAEAPRQIDDALAAAQRHKRPVYIEIPRDMVDAPCAAPSPLKNDPARSDPHALAEAVAEAADLLRAARHPALLAGVEIHRFALQKQLIKLVERTGYPVAATLLGKSVLSERHPQYLGVYEGAMGRDAVRKPIENADALLITGAFMTDINLGIHTARLDESRTINATSERITISHHHYEDVTLRDFIEKLAKADIGKRRRNVVPKKPAVKPFKPRISKPVTVRRFFERLDQYIGDHTTVICDIGDSLFGATDLTIHQKTEFLSPAYYTSMGFAVPAALGAQIADRKKRPVVFVGDGAFQMTCHEISTLVRHHLNPIIFVLNNKGYTTERIIHEGPYNDIHNWAYHLYPQLVREGWGAEVRTEGELEDALTRAAANTACFSILNVHLDKLDHSASLARLGARLGKVKSLSCCKFVKGRVSGRRVGVGC